METNIKVHVDKNTKYIQHLFNLRQEDNAQFKSKILEVVGSHADQGSTKEREAYFKARRSLKF